MAIAVAVREGDPPTTSRTRRSWSLLSETGPAVPAVADTRRTFSTLAFDHHLAQGDLAIGDLRQAFCQVCLVSDWRSGFAKTVRLSGPRACWCLRMGVAWFHGVAPTLEPVSVRHVGMPGIYQVSSAGQTPVDRALCAGIRLAFP